jgi:uncharacterized protein YcaQ
LLDRLAYGDPDASGEGRRLFEAWFHAACYLPLTEYRYRIPRMERARVGRRERTRTWLAKPETQALLKQVYVRVEREGALRARDFEDDRDSRGLWWDWKPAKSALEYLFSCGDLMIANRIRFERVYDLAERVRPEWVDVDAPAHEEAGLHVLERSAKASGICSISQVADYSHDFGRTDARPFLDTLLKQGTLIPIQVMGESGNTLEMVIHKENMPILESAAEGAMVAERTTFLSPFDSFFYPKRRDEQLWGFRQVLEAYKPAPQREWGYYCMPILHKDRLIGRIDPRLDRKAERLHIEAMYLEPGIKPEEDIISSIVVALRDFMAFHKARDLSIESSRPRGLSKSIMRML